MSRTSMDPELDTREAEITARLNAPATSNGTSPRAPITVRTLQDLADDPALSSPPDWVLQPFFERGTLNSIYGIGKGGKSTMLQHVAVHVATGAAWAGYEVRQGPVLWVDLEQGPRRLLRNFKAVAGWESAGILTVSDLGNPPALTDIRTMAEQYKPVVIVIDSLSKFCQVQDDNSSSEWQAALAPLETFARTSSAAVIVIDHDRKGEGLDGRAMRGASSKLAAFDTAILVTRAGGTMRKLSVVSREMGDLTVTVDRTETGYRLASGGEAVCVVLAALRSLGDSISITALHHHLSERGQKSDRKTVENRLKIAVQDGHAIATGRGTKNDPTMYTAVTTSSHEGKFDGNP
jgi:hypothetical protein